MDFGFIEKIFRVRIEQEMGKNCKKKILMALCCNYSGTK